jgi:3-mercaptopyruvate sulfurtransferase SseA
VRPAISSRSRPDLVVSPAELPRWLSMVPRDTLVVVYGRRFRPGNSERTGPDGDIALRLSRAGCRRLRPLAGGLRAWRRRGYAVECLSSRSRD